MKSRFVVVTIDTIAEIIRDYVADESDIPADAMPVSMQINPINKKLAITFVSDNWKEQPAPLAVNFDIKRIYAV